MHSILKNKNGIALLFVLIIMTTLIAITVVFLYMRSTGAKGGAGDVVSSKSLWLAEAGLQDVLYKLKNDSGYRATPTTVNSSLGEGTYTVTVVKVGNNYTLTSTGIVDNLSRRITQTVVASQGAPESFSYAQHSGSNINFRISGGTLTGNISAVGEVRNEQNMTINGTITENSTVPTPTVTINSYIDIANNIVNGDKTFLTGQTYSGIWYVDGNVTIRSNVTINGSIIATGNITIRRDSADITINPTSPNPALVSGGNITANGLENTNITGLIYAVNNIRMDRNENITIDGSMIAGGVIRIRTGQGLNITYNSNLQSNPPPYFSGGGGSVTVTAQKDWNEVPTQ